MIEGIPETLLTSVPVIGVLITWLMSLREQVKEWRDSYERLEIEYRQTLKDAAGLRAQSIVNEAHMAGRLYQAGDETQPMKRIDGGD